MSLLSAFRKTPATSEELKARAAKLQRQLDKLMASDDLVQAATAAALNENGGAERFAKIQTKASELKSEIEKLTLASQGVGERERIVRAQERERQIAATRSYAKATTEKFEAAIRRHDDCVARVIAELKGVRAELKKAHADWLGRIAAVDWPDTFSVPELSQRLDRVMAALATGKMHPLAEEFDDTLAEIKRQLSGAAKPRSVEDDTPPPRTPEELWLEWTETVGLAPQDYTMQRVIAQTRETLGGGKQSMVRANQNLHVLEKYFADPARLHYARAKEMYAAGLETEFGRDLHARCPGTAICPSFLAAMYDRSIPGVRLETAQLPAEPSPAQLQNVFPANPEAKRDFDAANARRIAATKTIAEVMAEHRRAKIDLGAALGLPPVPPKPAEPMEAEPEEDVGTVEEILTGAADDLGIAPAEQSAQQSEAENTVQPEQDDHVKW